MENPATVQKIRIFFYFYKKTFISLHEFYQKTGPSIKDVLKHELCLKPILIDNNFFWLLNLTTGSWYNLHQRKITCEQCLDINYIMSSHNVCSFGLKGTVSIIFL